MRVFAILTRFRHHKPDGGYKRLLAELDGISGLEVHEFGNDETNDLFPRTNLDKLQSSYKWIAEWRAWDFAKSQKPHLVHIMYGEEYFRFSHRLFKGIPLVATFHQPADVLDRELRHGDHGGRIAGLTHRMNKNRFQSLAAAIVTNPDQKVILEQFMPGERIHVIPLGVDVNEGRLAAHHERSGILTLGNWFRNWNTYVEVVQRMPELNFNLVNRQLPAEVAEKIEHLSNCAYHADISDAALQQMIQSSELAFLPLKKLAGSNALLECLAGGLPLVMSDVNAEIWKQSDVVALFEPDNVDQAIDLIRQKKGSIQLAHRSECVEIAKSFSWSVVARNTYQLYQKLT